MSQGPEQEEGCECSLGRPRKAGSGVGLPIALEWNACYPYLNIQGQDLRKLENTKRLRFHMWCFNSAARGGHRAMEKRKLPTARSCRDWVQPGPVTPGPGAIMPGRGSPASCQRPSAAPLSAALSPLSAPGEGCSSVLLFTWWAFSPGGQRNLTPGGKDTSSPSEPLWPPGASSSRFRIRILRPQDQCGRQGPGGVSRKAGPACK